MVPGARGALHVVTELSYAGFRLAAADYEPIKRHGRQQPGRIWRKAIRVTLQDPRSAGLADVRWHFSPFGWGVLAFAVVAAYIPFAGVLNGLFGVWNLQPEYSHGVLIPVISLFLIWRERAALVRSPFTGSWLGVGLVVLGIFLWALGELSTIWVIAQYAFLVALYGLVLALTGGSVFRRLWMPLLILWFMIPLPAFFAGSLSLDLQLLSSTLGTALIRLAGISVYLDGNVIDLGTYKLQVAEACSGLRYLFPLMTLAFIVAYLFRGAAWKRAVLFLASIPIAVFMNSLRIGLIGVTVEFWGVKMAEGVLHAFEGWVVFMASMLVLLMIAVMLARIGQPHARLRDVLLLDAGPAPVRAATNRLRVLPAPFLAGTALAALAAALTFAMPSRDELRPERLSFVEFPMQLGGWQGARSPLDAVYLDELKLDDYLLADYHEAADPPVNVWIAYYASQRKGQSAHSPRSCLPGGGWEFNTLARYKLHTAAGSLTVNRAVIEHGAERALMYYWFQQRGRELTNEYLVKWYIFQDAVARQRTDGALVRLMTPIPPGTNAVEADRELTQFAGKLFAQLRPYVPD
jgi:exosortase D (VPLPA-CTERM-specific)